MKKTVSLLLMLVMVLTSMTLAFAADYSDMSGSEYVKAVDVLSEEGVLNGYGDGTFRPTKSITRAEFAKVIVMACYAYESDAPAARFSDVASNKWYASFIAKAAEHNVVNGYGDGTFRPERNITNTQAIVMVLRAMGYTDEYFGGYNADKYISQANNLGILIGVKTGSDASTRGNVAQLVYNAFYKMMYEGDDTPYNQKQYTGLYKDLIDVTINNLPWYDQFLADRPISQLTKEYYWDWEVYQPDDSHIEISIGSYGLTGGAEDLIATWTYDPLTEKWGGTLNQDSWTAQEYGY